MSRCTFRYLTRPKLSGPNSLMSLSWSLFLGRLHTPQYCPVTIGNHNRFVILVSLQKCSESIPKSHLLEKYWCSFSYFKLAHGSTFLSWSFLSITWWLYILIGGLIFWHLQVFTRSHWPKLKSSYRWGWCTQWQFKGFLEWFRRFLDCCLWASW